jgi:hypothetical protein
MTIKDIDLIQTALKMSVHDHGLVEDLICQAETDDAKELLKKISRRYYHIEESWAGNS